MSRLYDAVANGAQDMCELHVLGLGFAFSVLGFQLSASLAENWEPRTAN